MTDPLTQIGLWAGTDKATFHGYTRHYHELLKGFRDQQLFFLELGFGGYEWPGAGGESVRMWAKYAPNWDIAVVDLYEKESRLVPDGASFYRGSQDDKSLMDDIIERHGRPTIVIDDASHISKLTNKSFDILWPTVLPGGWYIVEDIGTSYTKIHGGHPKGGPGTSIWELGKALIDNVMANSAYGQDQNIIPGTPDMGIDVLHVMPGSIAIRKQK